MVDAKFFKSKKSRVAAEPGIEGAGKKKASLKDMFKVMVIVVGMLMIFVVAW